MVVSFPIRYDLEPRKVDPGLRWVKLTLHNMGSDDLTGLDVRLNSLDTYSIGVSSVEVTIPTLQPGEEKLCAFQISANLTGQLYITLDGWQNEERFHWDSPGIWVTVGEEMEELIDFEETLHTLNEGEDFAIELWTQTPDDLFLGPPDTLPEALSVEEADHPEALPGAGIVRLEKEEREDEDPPSRSRGLPAVPGTGSRGARDVRYGEDNGPGGSRRAERRDAGGVSPADRGSGDSGSPLRLWRVVDENRLLGGKNDEQP